MRPRPFMHSTIADAQRKVGRAAALLLVFGALAAGCGQDSTGPVTSSAQVTAPWAPADGVAADSTRTATSVAVIGLPRVGVDHQSLLVHSRFSDDRGVWWPNASPSTWTSSDPAVATVGGGATYAGTGPVVVAIVGAGVATISVSVNGLTAEDTITGLEGTPPLSDALAVDSFRVVELTYPETGPSHWYYAPLVVVRDASGTGIEVFGVQLGVPGVVVSGYCTSARAVPSGQSVELFREVYGDYELTWDRPGYRADPGDATVTVYFLDRAGNAGRVEATGPVLPGPSSRDTYTGRSIPDPWSCGQPGMPS